LESTLLDSFVGSVKDAGVGIAFRAIQAAARVDSWVNTATAFGTSADKTTKSVPMTGCRLTMPQITALYTEDHLAAKIVDVYPREALRVPLTVGGLTQEQTASLNLNAPGENDRTLVSVVEEAWIWGRCYGGAAIWPMTTDGDNLVTPANPSAEVMALRVVDRRQLNVATRYQNGPKAGLPETYWVTDQNGTRLSRVHETRLILFPGALTDRETKQRLDGWDLSVLQRPYEALRAAGAIYKGIEIQVTDGNQGVYKIKNLIAMMAGKHGEQLLARLRLMQESRSVARAVVLDAEVEDFQQLSAKLDGLVGLGEFGHKLVAAAAEIPVTILIGESPAGLNATGESDLRWFHFRVEAARKNVADPRLVQLIRMVNPRIPRETKLTLEWGSLWQPSAKEQIEMQKMQAETDQIYIVSEVARPEEIALSRFTEAGWSGVTKIDRELREAFLAADKTLPSEAAAQEAEAEGNENEENGPPTNLPTET
jgi:phage-related protein (TIGR01555 family)